MANIAIVLGKSGAGKSTSIKSLNPDETVIINPLQKRLPFKGSASMYNKEKYNLINVDSYADVISWLNKIGSGSKIKTIVIDDAIYVMRKEYFKRAKETGYGKYTELAQHFQQIIQTCEGLRDDLNIFFMLHSEDIQSDKTITGYKVSTIGNLIDQQYNPVEVVPMVLYASIKYDDKGNASYGFYTHRCMDGIVEIPAKSPDGMFEEDFIPNDLAVVIKAMQEYYN